jgi:NTP pyrophosphatase (non-canonical NTP hydrolase)
MDYEKYIKDATRTESRIDDVVTSQKALAEAMQLFILSAQILDLFKRQVFYKKDFADDQLAPLLSQIHQISAPDNGERCADTIDVNPRILHASMGFATEAGEIMEALVDSMEGEAFDRVNFMEELGDLNWYQAIAMDETGLNIKDILTKNIDKLKARFPDKFSEHRAVERDLERERDILEAAHDGK